MAAIVNTVKETLGMGEGTKAPQAPETTSTTTATNAAANPTAAAVTQDDHPEDNHLAEPLEADNDGGDSAHGSDDASSAYSDTTSITSTIYRGHMMYGRKYQSLREGEYWGPSDEQQHESMNAAHRMSFAMDWQEENPLFRSPIGNNPQNILDIGTGSGAWAIDVADAFPSAFVQGVDLAPVLHDWVPPNCKFEVDDLLKTWMFKEKFDLVHLRFMLGSFTDRQWRLIYKQAYDNILPGGWIEQLEPRVGMYSDDGTIPADSIFAKWGSLIINAAEGGGKSLTTEAHIASRLSAAGFKNVHEKLYKVPFGTWARSPQNKEAGSFNMLQFLEGVEGYVTHFLTNFAEPKPWTMDEVKALLEKVKEECKHCERSWHVYWYYRRVWAQKPMEKRKEEKAKTESFEA